MNKFFKASTIALIFILSIYFVVFALPSYWEENTGSWAEFSGYRLGSTVYSDYFYIDSIDVCGHEYAIAGLLWDVQMSRLNQYSGFRVATNQGTYWRLPQGANGQHWIKAQYYPYSVSTNEGFDTIFDAWPHTSTDNGAYPCEDGCTGDSEWGRNQVVFRYGYNDTSVDVALVAVICSDGAQFATPTPTLTPAPTPCPTENIAPPVPVDWQENGVGNTVFVAPPIGIESWWVVFQGDNVITTPLPDARNCWALQPCLMPNLAGEYLCSGLAASCIAEVVNYLPAEGWCGTYDPEGLAPDFEEDLEDFIVIVVQDASCFTWDIPSAAAIGFDGFTGRLCFQPRKVTGLNLGNYNLMPWLTLISTAFGLVVFAWVVRR